MNQPTQPGVRATSAILSMLACCAALGACGGGGDSGSGDTVYPAPAGSRLGAYLGTWASACSGNQVDTATITRTSDTGIRIAGKTEYFAQADCSGQAAATVTRTADTSASYRDSIDAGVVLQPGAPAVVVRIDRVSATLPQHVLAVNGPGVMRQTVGGQPQWCIVLAGGLSSCLPDPGTVPAASSDAALYASADTLYELAPQGGGYAVTQRYTRRPG